MAENIREVLAFVAWSTIAWLAGATLAVLTGDRWFGGELSSFLFWCAFPSRRFLTLTPWFKAAPNA